MYLASNPVLAPRLNSSLFIICRLSTAVCCVNAKPFQSFKSPVTGLILFSSLLIRPLKRVFDVPQQNCNPVATIDKEQSRLLTRSFRKCKGEANLHQSMRPESYELFEILAPSRKSPQVFQ